MIRLHENCSKSIFLAPFRLKPRLCSQTALESRRDSFQGGALVPCGLQPDPSFACDFKGTAGNPVNILVRATAPAAIFRAELNGNALVLSADKQRTSFNIPAGGGALLIEVTAAPGDT